MSRFSIPEAMLEDAQGDCDVLGLMYEMQYEVIRADETNKEKYQDYSELIDNSDDEEAQAFSFNLYEHFGYEGEEFFFEGKLTPCFWHMTDFFSSFCQICYNTDKKSYIDHFMEFRVDQAMIELSLAMHGPCPLGGYWEGSFVPVTDAAWNRVNEIVLAQAARASVAEEQEPDYEWHAWGLDEADLPESYSYEDSSYELSNDEDSEIDSEEGNTVCSDDAKEDLNDGED